MVDRIGELEGIIYINEGYYRQPKTKRVLSGAFLHNVVMSGAQTTVGAGTLRMWWR